MLLPHFPLHTVLFPHLPLPLHLFEERYQAMANDVMADGSPYAGRFVISMITEGMEVGGEATTQAIGTICEVRSAERFPDGRWMVIVVGLARAKLGPVDRSGPYALVEASEIPEPTGDEAEALLPRIQEALDAYLATVKRFVARTASGGHDAQQSRDVTASLDSVLKPIQLPDDISNDYPGNNASKDEIAKWLAKQADKHGLPPELPVMASLVESGVKNLNFGDADSVGFFQMRVGIWNQGDYKGFPQHPELQAKWFIDQAVAVKKQAIARGDADFGKDPSKWGNWIADIERPAEQYRGRYQLRLREARGLLG